MYKDSSLITEGKGRTDDNGKFSVTSDIKDCENHVCELLIHAEKDTLQKTIIIPVSRPVFIGDNHPYISLLQNLQDTVVAAIYGLSVGEENYLRIYQDTMLLFTGNFRPDDKMAIIKLPRDSLPEGNIRIVVYDDNNEPLTEKQIVLLPRFLSLDIMPNQLRYKRRSLCKVKIGCRNTGLPVGGLAIISCALRTRTSNTKGDIENCYYNYQGASTVSLRHDGEALSGSTINLNGRPSRHQQVMLVGGLQQLSLLKSDSVARFTLRKEHLISSDNELVTISESGKYPGRIDIFEPDVLVNEQLASYYFSGGAETSNINEVFTGEEMANLHKTLATMTVKAQYNTEDNSLFPDMCKVWVCACGHFMCNYCPPKRQPIKGRIYRYMGRDFEYTGCEQNKENPFIRQIKAYMMPTAFDGLADTASTEQELYTTLLFKPIVIDHTGEANIEFFTNDLKGEFLLAVKLMTAYGPISAEKTFVVEE